MPDTGTLDHLREELEILRRVWADPLVAKLIINGNEIRIPKEPAQRQRFVIALGMGAFAQYFTAQGFEPELLEFTDWVKTAALEAAKGTRYPLFEPEMPHSRPVEPLIASRTVARACVLLEVALGARNRPPKKRVAETLAGTLNANGVKPPEAYSVAGQKAVRPLSCWGGLKLLRLWDEINRVGEIPRASRAKGQATIRRELYETEWRNAEGLPPLDIADRVLGAMIADQQ
jgi:hypothetical protein